jgi:adenine-specific DNA-methyltransferase
METQYEKLKKILQQMFQMDQADLDFGIYRIMNQKREEIERFLDKELLPQVKQEFIRYKSAEARERQKELERLVKTLKNADVDPDTNPKVLKIKEEITAYGNEDSLANEVFSHLTTFFRRYYDDGDFLSLRRYKKDTYAIPYEGEEVKLHWANADQYYIKSSEYLRDYVFKLPGQKRVHFKLVDATDEKDNIKQEHGKERRFRLCGNEPVKIEGDNLYIRFTYLPDNTKQTDLNKKTLEYIVDIHNKSNQLNSFDKMFEPMPTAKNPHRTLLEKHLNNYTARFNFDFFIHKKLGGFLRRELDFYIKNEVLFIDDLDEKDERQVFQSIGKIKVLKRIAHKIITFLAQIEDFQKKLWLKKKFVVECGYCVTLDRVPEELYDEIAKNDAQREEWVRLFAINEVKKDLINPGYTKPLTVKFLKANPYLVIDTKFFDDEFKEKLLASFDNIDETCDGVIINSENFQALNLLLKKYRKQIKCIYIDPPYNTDGAEIIYKNNYKDSSWASLLYDRLCVSKNYLNVDGLLCSTIDECEVNILSFLMIQVFPESILRPVVIEYNHRGRVKSNFAITHEYALWVIKNGKNLITRKREISEDINRNLRRTGTDSTREASPGQFYGIEVDKGSLAIVGVTEPLVLGAKIPPHNNSNTEMIWPIDDQGIERRWYYGADRILSESKEETVWAKRIKGKIQIHYHQDGKPKIRKSVWVGPSLDASTYGSELLNDIFGMGKASFSFPKSINAVKECLEAASYSNTVTFMDFFSGSGTTAHAIINLNREDCGKRKYILVEMGQYFDTVLKPRIQKVIYSKDWKDGKPVSREGISHMFKYMKLESYEDTLDNLIIKRDEKQQKFLLSLSSKTVKEEYMLGYMLDIEIRESDSLLNIDRFEDPFNYTLEIRHDNELKTTKIDLVETFNYLIGLYVEQTKVIHGFKVIRGRLRTGEKTLVIWRNTKNKTNRELEAFFLKQGYDTRDFEFDKIYVNGDNNLENLKCAEDKWKVSLIEEEFKKRMFDVKDV